MYQTINQVLVYFVTIVFIMINSHNDIDKVLMSRTLQGCKSHDSHMIEASTL